MNSYLIKKEKQPNPMTPMHLVALIDLSLFTLLSFRSGVFVMFILMIGASKVVLNYLTYIILRKYKMGDTYLAIIVAMILSLGLAMQLRLSTDVGFKQFIWYLTGLSIFLVTSSIFQLVNKRIRSIWFFYILMIILFILTLLIGKSINGAKNWIVLGKISFQPSEFIKILFVFFIASFVSNPEALRLKLGDRSASPKWILMIMVFIILGFFVLQREFGTALLIFMVYLSTIYVFEKAITFIATNAILAGSAALIAVKIMPHLQVRVDSWLNPFADIAGKGYQITQSLFAIGSGSFFGTGIGFGYPHFIPNVETDFIFSAICEEMGIFGGIAIIIMFVLLLYRGIKICLGLRDPFTKSLAFGLTITVAFQTFLIIGGVTKLIPLTGITLPFVSYGGSSMLSSFLILGLLQALSGSILREEAFEFEKIDNK
ncbi:FtsW/RodA/SpoVE family cell cycle protein [Fusibacter bizertensis]|uniref:FtsW/RodA/SpoVE family cell cycle protein n=1 Tax=Fusibacter bizertensis TaxID=1488331 RepID=A0ABT6NG39_9FIRM|nr:FtsW/RodA/SpoVE family cell cycle protein [Fusibacter bizertensis]MDH8679387.1 FtsW/RodA/SpoVE family cell cycle protein [Fusibacter bizertensis]